MSLFKKKKIEEKKEREATPEEATPEEAKESRLLLANRIFVNDWKEKYTIFAELLITQGCDPEKVPVLAKAIADKYLDGWKEKIGWEEQDEHFET